MEISLPNPNKGHRQNASSLSYFSAAAYHGAGCVDRGGFHSQCLRAVRKLADSRGDTYTHLERGNASILHYVSGKDLEIVAIAGSNDSRDWRNNLDVGKFNLRDWCSANGFPYSGHGNEAMPAGFLSYTGLAANALAGITSFKAGTLYLTGHSLGGAAVCLLPQIMPACLPKGIYTYGAPRFILKGTCLPEQHPTYRYVRIYDPVPWFPRLKYQHPASDVSYIRYEGSLYPRRTLSSWLLCLYYWTTHLHQPIPGASEVHAIERYCRDLNP